MAAITGSGCSFHRVRLPRTALSARKSLRQGTPPSVWTEKRQYALGVFDFDNNNTIIEYFAFFYKIGYNRERIGGGSRLPDKMILVDGYSLIYRAFHALPPLDDGNGTPTNAVYGFFSMLLKILNDERPAYCAVAFDGREKTFRHVAYEAYKATRAPMPDELRPQPPIIIELLSAMGLKVVTLEGYEADDILGTLSARCESANVDALIVTGDRDSFQLVGARTNVLYTKRGITDTVLMTEEAIRERYGVEPEKLVDVKGLMGDSSDNIPGVPGVGEKTALKLIWEYGTLENALGRADADQKGKLRERLLEYADQARLSKELATIDRNIPLSGCLDDYRIGEAHGAREKFEAFKLNTLISKLDRYLRGGEAEKPVRRKERAWKPREEIKHLEAFGMRAAEMSGGGAVALSFNDALSVASEGGDQIEIVLGGDLLTPGVSEEEALNSLGPVFASPAHLVVHDVKRLMHTLGRLNLSLKGEAYDVMLAAYCLNAGRKKFDLSSLLSDVKGDNGLTEAAQMLLLREMQRQKLNEDGSLELYEQIERPLADALCSMEREGFLIDREELRRLGDEYSAKISELSKGIHAFTGEQLNINSPKQLGEFLFGTLGLQGGKKTNTGFSTSADVLEQLADQHDVIPLILTYRKYSKLQSTYIEALARLCGPDGRIHTSFDQVATATGRISSQEPNLQNIPIRTELGREIRRAFIAKDGCILVDADYSQIELRVLAHMSGDETMRDAFLRDQDIHRRTASEVFGMPFDEVTSDMRSAAKAVNFGIVYGISDFGLARNTGMTKKEAGAFIERYLNHYPGVKRFMDDCVAMGKLNGYVETLFKRRRYLPEMDSSNYNIRSFGERAAMNSPIQGSAADIIKLAMVKVNHALDANKFRARLILQVHDELILEAPVEEAAEASALLKECMETVVALAVPLKADVSIGENWYVCK